MEVHLPPETEAQLDELAKRTNRGTDELLVEAVSHLVEYNEWFARKVRKGIEDVEAGRTVSHEKVGEWLEKRFKRQSDVR